jgi:hypothetical protein
MQVLNCHNRTWMPNQRIGLLIDAALTILMKKGISSDSSTATSAAEWNAVWAAASF